jgi:hypothetical protein
MNPRISHTTTGARAENVSGSCAILALANVIGLSYENATKFAIKHLPIRTIVTDRDGKQHVRGTYTARPAFIEGVRKLGRDAKRFAHVVKPGDVMSSNIKLDTLVNLLPKGRFIVSIQGHAVAVVDNQICDNNYAERTCRNSFVKQVIEVSPRGQKIEHEFIQLKDGRKVHTFESYLSLTK